jgi:hypothetical protein
VLRRRGSSCQVGVWTGEKTGFGREKKRVDEGKGRLRSRGSSWDRAWVQMLSACAAVAHFDGVRVVWVMDGSSALASVRGGVHEVVPLWGAVLVVQCEVKCVPRFSLQGGGGAAFPCDVSRAKPGYMLEVALKPCLFGWRVGLACAIWPRGGGCQWSLYLRSSIQTSHLFTYFIYSEQQVRTWPCLCVTLHTVTDH